MISDETPEHAPGWPKWWLLTGFWVVQALAMLTIWGVAIAPGWLDGDDWLQDFSRGLMEPEFLILALPTIAAVTLMQAIFVWPVRRPMPGRGGISARASLAIAGLCAALLATALIMALREIPWLIQTYAPQPPGGTKVSDSQAAWPMPLSLPFFAMVGLTWIIVTPLLIAFVRGPMFERRLGRLAAILFTGTIVEVAAIIPIDVLVRKKSGCYCEQGSMWALTICGGVGTVFLGPAIWLPLLAKRRKRWYAGHCDACGYDMRGCMKAERCPECGCGWKPAA